MKTKHTEKLFTDEKTDGVAKNVSGKQTIQTENTKIVKKEKDKENEEILIGKSIEEVDKMKEGRDNLQKKILEKLMK
ncbi:hypothetical protein [Polaribacter sp. R77954]|uniref:hypothetical protein n=1 Tax=Polaribacter sp. R77954 TaxID=3093870 RepID=UPI0037C6F5AD